MTLTLHGGGAAVFHHSKLHLGIRTRKTTMVQLKKSGISFLGHDAKRERILSNKPCGISEEMEDFFGTAERESYFIRKKSLVYISQESTWGPVSRNVFVAEPKVGCRTTNEVVVSDIFQNAFPAEKIRPNSCLLRIRI